MRYIQLYLIFSALFGIQSAFAIDPPNDMRGAILGDEYLEFLGIGGDFGRWENGIIPIAYNHSNAPAQFSSAEIESRLLTAFAILEGTAGVTFDYRGLTSAPILDFSDGLVVVGWNALDPGIAGLAGPSFGDDGLLDFANYRRLGHWPYLDGSVELDTVAPSPTQSVIVHELIHLLGFGHSENPISIMNTTFFHFDAPEEDDIDALQSLYGPPDVFVDARLQIELDAANLRSGIELDDFYFEVLSDDSPSDSLAPIERVDSDTPTAAWIYATVAYRGVIPGEEMVFYVSPPAGSPTLQGPYEFQFEAGFFRVGIQRSESMIMQPGIWKVTAGMDGGLLGEAEILVEGESPFINQRPEASLSVSSDQQGNFQLGLTVADAEGDGHESNWFIPQRNVTSDVLSVDVNVSDGQPIQIFVEIDEQVTRSVDVPGGAGAGFAELASAFLATPAEADVPTYFVSRSLLHIPKIEIGGQVYAMNFQLTANAGIQLKLLEYFELSQSGANPASSYDPATQSVTIPRLIVNDNAVLSEFANLKFVLDFGFNPVTLRLTDS